MEELSVAQQQEEPPPVGDSQEDQLSDGSNSGDVPSETLNLSRYVASSTTCTNETFHCSSICQLPYIFSIIDILYILMMSSLPYWAAFLISCVLLCYCVMAVRTWSWK